MSIHFFIARLTAIAISWMISFGCWLLYHWRITSHQSVSDKLPAKKPLERTESKQMSLSFELDDVRKLDGTAQMVLNGFQIFDLS